MVSFGLISMKRSNRITNICIALAVVLCLSFITNANDACMYKLRRVRKPLHRLTSAEWTAFNRGFLTLKKTGQLTELTRIHRSGMQYHGTPFFLPMHRALMVAFEDALLKVEPTLTGCPYWDELRETSGLGKSDVFTRDRLSPIVRGPLTGAYSGLTDDLNQTVTRNPSRVSTEFYWLPPDEVMTKAMVRINTFGDFSRSIEMSPHNQIHMLIGGQMGRTTLSPCDPAFWVHHCYIDMLWALWQSLRRQNYLDLTVFGGQGPRPRDGVVLFPNRWTYRDMTMYRERLCYEYTMPSTRATRLNRRSSAQTPSPKKSDSDAHQVVKDKPAKCAKTKPYFKPMWKVSDERIKEFMPNCTIKEWRDAESEIIKVIDELNTGISSGEINPDELPTIRSLFENSNMNCTSSSLTDDYQDSFIPEVQQLAQNSRNAQPSGSAHSLDPMHTTISYFSLLMVAFFLCF